jgi:hypothetical protein
MPLENLSLMEREFKILGKLQLSLHTMVITTAAYGESVGK